MPRITPNLWFDTQGLEAAEFYVSVFPNSEITDVTHYDDAGPRPAGTVLTVEFVLDGQEFIAINGGPEFTFDEAISLLVNCADQKEIDYYWDKLSEGGEEGPVRMAQGQVRPVVAGRAGRDGRDAERPGHGTRAAGNAGRARHEEARHRRHLRGRRPALIRHRRAVVNAGLTIRLRQHRVDA